MPDRGSVDFLGGPRRGHLGHAPNVGHFSFLFVSFFCEGIWAPTKKIVNQVCGVFCFVFEGTLAWAPLPSMGLLLPHPKVKPATASG